MLYQESGMIFYRLKPTFPKINVLDRHISDLRCWVLINKYKFRWLSRCTHHVGSPVLCRKHLESAHFATVYGPRVPAPPGFWQISSSLIIHPMIWLLSGANHLSPSPSLQLSERNLWGSLPSLEQAPNCLDKNWPPLLLVFLCWLSYDMCLPSTLLGLPGCSLNLDSCPVGQIAADLQAKQNSWKPDNDFFFFFPPF